MAEQREMHRNLDQAMENYEDEDVERCLNWFKSFMSPGEWDTRRAKVENYIEHATMVAYGIDKAEAPTLSVSFNEDKIAWYMYLLDTCMHDASCYEPVAGARVFPVFLRLGQCFTELTSIEGINKKVRRLIKKDPSEADAVLFELLVALVWVRNGYKVSFIPELKSKKQPDIKAVKKDKEWFIECKRLSKSPDYSAREKEKWLVMLSHIRNILMDRDLVLNAVFHEELEKLSDTFLYDELAEKLKLIKEPGWLIDNDQISVTAWFVDYSAINSHLEAFSVRTPSPQLNALIGGELDDDKGFSSGTIAKVFRLGAGIGNNIFVDQVGKAFGAFWSCDAPAATDAKARDIKQHLEKALKQLPMIENSVVHVGIETYDGLDVEVTRFSKINKTINEIGIANQNLKWIYVHFFQSYAPPDQSWVFDESLARFRNVLLKAPEPLKKTSLIVPFEKTEKNNLHWFKPQPL